MGESYIQSQLELLKILPNSTSDEVFTGEGVALEIVTSLVSWIEPDIFKNPSSKFLDIYTKSGIFLLLLYEVLMENLADTIADESERSNHILSNMLYGISPSLELALVSRKTLYGNWSTVGNIKYLQGYKDKVKKDFKGMDKELGTMKFDVVIGNPPYNNDVYLDFVTLAHQLSSKYTCMITPAKWQAKGGEKNEKFRRDIVPYMSHIVYYPNSHDVFNVAERGGISYCILDKKEHNIKEYKVVDKAHPLISSKNSAVDYRKKSCLHNDNINKIISKCCIGGRLNIDVKTSRFNVFTSLMVCSAQVDSLYPKDGLLLVLNPMNIVENCSTYKSSNYKMVFSSSTKDECESFVSYTNTRLVRFLIFVGLCGNSVISREAWRFVPDPGAFDHIFTDEELYQKYSLTPEEIAIIESVIKERKPKE